MNMFSPGSPQTIFDWAAIREEFREKPDLLPTESLAIVYGLSCTAGYRDDEFVRVVDAYLETVTDPVRTRFDFAYDLSSWFWDKYSGWGYALLTEPPADRPYRTVKRINNRADLYSIKFLPNEPGYVGDLLDGLHDKVLQWLLEGLATYVDEQDVFDKAFFLVSRLGLGDTLLEAEDKPLMEAAANTEISLRTSETGRRMIERVVDIFNEEFGRKEEKKDQPDES